MFKFYNFFAIFFLKYNIGNVRSISKSYQYITKKVYYITKNSTSKLMSVILDLNKSNIQLKISDTQNAIQLLK